MQTGNFLLFCILRLTNSGPRAKISSRGDLSMQIQMAEKNKLFNGIAGPDLERLLTCSKSRFRTYPQGTVVYQQENQPKKLFVMLKGRAAVIKILFSGKKNILYEVADDSVFGENSFFHQGEHNVCGVEALTDLEVLEIPWDFFSCFCDEGCKLHRRLIQNMLEILSQKEWQATKKLSIVSSTSLKTRLIRWLLMEANEEGIVRLTMNREELADFLGVARPSLSRTLAQLKEEDVIELLKKEIRIKNFSKIENLYE